MKALYTAKATTKGGRKGHVKSSDEVIDMKLDTPKEMGGEGGNYTNPEQLFAAGYSSCFGSALEIVMKKAKLDPKDVEITTEVTIGKADDNGFELSVNMIGSIPGVEEEKAKALMEQAHEVCPYSKATRGNIEVTLNVK